MLSAEPRLSDECWQVLKAAHPNVLIIGARAMTSPIVRAIADMSPSPVCWCNAARMRLPSNRVATLILQNAPELHAEAQQTLLGWLNEHAGTQIIAESTSPLFSQVTVGTFNDELYYRLNTIVIDDV